MEVQNTEYSTTLCDLCVVKKTPNNLEIGENAVIHKTEQCENKRLKSFKR